MLVGTRHPSHRAPSPGGGDRWDVLLCLESEPNVFSLPSRPPVAAAVVSHTMTAQLPTVSSASMEPAGLVQVAGRRSQRVCKCPLRSAVLGLQASQPPLQAAWTSTSVPEPPESPGAKRKGESEQWAEGQLASALLGRPEALRLDS